MANIIWSPGALSTFSPEELACAAAGGSWDRATQHCTYPPMNPLPPAPPLLPPGSGGGGPANQSDPQVCTLEKGWWLQSLALMDGLTIIPVDANGQCNPPGLGGRPPGLSAPVPVLPGPGGLPGYGVPPAPGVLLPSFVGGNLGEVRDPGGMRPVSGGRPERVHMGPSDIPVVRMKERWDLRS